MKKNIVLKKKLTFSFRVKKKIYIKSNRYKLKKKFINRKNYPFNYSLEKYKKIRFIMYKNYYIKYIFRCNILITKNNFLIYCYTFLNKFIFQISLKKIGFKKKQKKSPFVIAVFFDLFYYYLMTNNVFFLNFVINGKNKFLKWYLKQLLYTKSFFFQKIIKNISKSFNGCKLSKMRRL